jgi:magnesium transporter
LNQGVWALKLFDYSKGLVSEGDVSANDFHEGSELFVICRTDEIRALRDIFGFDENTVLDCTDLDESVRYMSFGGYDFISLVHMDIEEGDFVLKEVNLYVSARYLVLVMPEHNSPRLARLEESILAASENIAARPGRIMRLYFLLLNGILVDFSDTLEALEDQMEEMAEAIGDHAYKNQLEDIGRLRKMAYTAKKQLRAHSYLGEQILIDENGLLDQEQTKYFRNADTRLKKLYGFAESLYELSNELLNTYDSKLTIKTNDTINKLTVITLFFAPLTVITGVYGMNFSYMPELQHQWGYPATLVIMMTICLLLYLILKKKNLL